MKSIITASLAMAFLASCSQSMVDGYAVNVEIPGIPEGAHVTMKVGEGFDKTILADTVLTDSDKFTLTGKIESPKVATINIEVPGRKDLYEAKLMLDNERYTVSAAHIDSMPIRTNAMLPDNLLKRKNVTVTGGRHQQEYQEYTDFMFPGQMAYTETYYNAFRSDREPMLSHEEAEAAQNKFDKLLTASILSKSDFAYAHPHYVVSAPIICQNLKMTFHHTPEEIDAIWEMVKNHPDSASLAQLTEAAAMARKMAKGTMFSDVVMTRKDGSEVKLSEFVGKGKPVLVDFWASWCGPCRMAIPHVRETCRRYPESLTVISASLDTEDAAWHKAMNEERMEWAQYKITPENKSVLKDFYMLRGIPYLVLFSGEGNILYAGSGPKDVDAELKKILD